MPVVDLSNIGLEGQQAFATRMSTLAQGRQMQAAAQEQELQNQETQMMNALNAQASAKLTSLAKGERTGGQIDVSGVASKMDSLSNPLEVTADIYARGGAPGKAMEMLKAASEIRKRESDIENDAVLTEQRRLENIIKTGNETAQAFGGVRNRSEAAFVLQDFRRKRLLEPEHLDQLDEIFSNADEEDIPELAAFFNEQGISAADRARNELTVAGQERQERQSAAIRGQEERKIRMQQQRDLDHERHRVWERKNGGKNAPNATVPTEQDRISARRLLKADIFRGAKDKDEDLLAAAEYVASQAKNILQTNKAISWDTAVQQAILRGQQDGALSIDPEKNEWFRSIPIIGGGNVPAKGRFKAPVGRTVDTPAPLPKSAAQMKKGSYYVTSKGIVQWDGTKGIPVND